ncbi:MAG: two-component system, OmpR family, response regulator [Solirubrobacterales bacterium]|nr:two-component system, OmpR family, response regulator [Solirubrobacterales bacterium]
MRLLIAEDEPKLANALARGLRRSGYAVDVIDSGDGALHQARVYEYDCVVLDVMLPGLDGFGVCSKLRTEGFGAPVLMLTARDQLDDRIRGLDAGADDYLVKPFAFDELVARLRALTRRGSSSRPAVLSFGELVIDPAARSVTHRGRSVELSQREFALLEFLGRHAGQVVRRTELLEHVWDQHFPGDSNIVDVYVGRLRKKLDAPAGELIRTVRGVGYSLEPTLE